MEHFPRTATPEQARLIRIDEAARALPDAMFAADPQIGALRADHDDKARRLQAVTTGFIATALMATIAELKERVSVSATKERLLLAAIDDATAGDLDFPRSTAVQRRIDDDNRKLEAADIAERALRLEAPRTIFLLRRQKSEADTALAKALLERKRQHLHEHPELMEGARAS